MALQGTIIARIDGDPVTLSEAELRVAGLASLHGDIADVMGKDWPDAIMTSLVEDRLIREAAEAAGIVVTKGEVADALARVKDLSGSPGDFDAWLAEQGLTYPELGTPDLDADPQRGRVRAGDDRRAGERRGASRVLPREPRGL